MDISDIAQTAVHSIRPYAIPIALLLAAFALVLLLLRKEIRRSWLDVRSRRCLKRLGYRQISNLQWPDGLGHYFTIDRLILRQNGITLLNHNQYPGKIFCADNIDDWTQMIGQKSYRFKNPLHELDYQIKTISASIPNVPVNGFLFFHHLAQFPKGHPERVIYLENIPAELVRDKKSQVEASVDSAWSELVTAAQKRGF